MVDLIDAADMAATKESLLRKEIISRMGGMSQIQFARILGVNQGLISRYLAYNDLGWKLARAISRRYPELKGLVSEVVL